MRPIRRDAPGDVSDYMDEMIHGQAVDEHGARIGIQDDGDLRVYTCGALREACSARSASIS